MLIYIFKTAGTSLLRYWRPIVIIALLGLYTYGAYRYGVRTADDRWVVKYNQQVAGQNARIKELEDLSVQQVTDLEVAQTKLAAKLSKIAGLPPILPKTRAGGELKCGNVVIREVFLGPEFSSRWNAINGEANK